MSEFPEPRPRSFPQSRLQPHRIGLLEDQGSPEKAAARSVHALWDAIRDAIDAVTPQDASVIG